MNKLIVLATLLILSCSHTTDLAGPGGSSETQNGFVCTALLSDGSPARNALVRVRSADYLALSENKAILNKLSIIDTNTDDSGRVTIKSLEQGNYFIEVNDRNSSAGLIHFTTDSTGRKLQSDTIMLLPYARVSGQIDTDNQNLKHVQVKGLDRITAISQDGSFSFNDLPGGVYTFVFTPDDPQDNPLIVDSMIIKPSQINMVGYRFTKTITLNTTASGANVSEDVFSFPVLIRCDGTDFHFLMDTALCFTKSDGTILPHQIEILDSLDSTAAVWVKVDTVKGNDSTLIYMHYGIESGLFKYNAGQVFDPDQFAGVWHLDEISNTEQGGYKDGTSHERNGTGVKIEPGRKNSGLIGLCQELNGVDGFIHVAGLLDQSKTLTISAWVKSTDSVGEIISIGDNAGMRFFSDKAGFGVYSYYSYKDVNSWLPISVGVDANQSRWHYISMVIDPSAGLVSLYLDAVLKTQAVMTGDLLYNKVGDDTYIGRAFRETCNFQGFIDEVRVCNRSRSSAWLKLCFENQQSDQTLVRF